MEATVLFRSVTKIIFAVCLCIGIACPAHADFSAGIAAYGKKDYGTALREFKAAPKISAANYNLGVMYYKGQGVKQDKAQAVKYMKKAAEQGHAKAQFLYSVMLFTGDGAEQSVPEAKKWIRKSADKGFAEAQFNLGMMYVNGDNIDKNRAEGVKWLKKAAKQGHPNARKLLKVMGEA